MNISFQNKFSSLLLFFLIITVAGGFLFIFFDIFNLNLFLERSSAAPRADAIAVRILENPHHYHPDRWYRKQGYQGQLQKLQIDGYRAVRSGRTTYVNVGNIESGELHTYIYLLSYSQDVEPATRRIYNRMIENWRFNTNLNTDGQCAISDLTCTQDQDCPGNYTCQTSGPQENKCLPPDPPACRADRNCPNHLYCDSQKSQVTRDTLRLGDLAEISILLERYKKNHNGKYPHLRAGTYLRGKTLSVWPSWQKEFARVLGSPLPEPRINTLGACNIDCCPGSCPDNSVCSYEFQARTCWDNIHKWFSDPTPGNDQFNLPQNSYAYVYEKTASGYDLCASTESGFIPGGTGDAACSSAATGGAAGSSGSATNEAPQISCGSLSGFPNSDFLGFASAQDPDGDEITNWSIDTSVCPDWSGWSASPQLQEASIPSQTRIHAADSGSEGTYDIELTATDSHGHSSSRVCTIQINPGLPTIDFIPDQNVVIGEGLEFLITATEPSNQYPLSYNFSASGYTVNYTLEDNRNAHIDQTYDDPSFLDPNYLTATHQVNVVATDSAGDTSPPATFSVTVVNQQPVIDTPINCPDEVRNNHAYPGCTISATDPDGHNIVNFSSPNLPPGMSIDSNGVISGTPTSIGTFDDIHVYAEDEYGAESEAGVFEIQVNTYCGDGIAQTPNSEGRGGPGNTGNEECDGTDNVASSPLDSSPSSEYDCTTPSQACPEPGSGNCLGTCSFTGGYCGDGIIQQQYGEHCEGSDGVVDGNSDGCSDNCQCQSPYSWSGSDCRHICSPFNFTEHWNWAPDSSLPNSTFGHVMMTPIVANLDNDSQSELLFIAFSDANAWSPDYRAGVVRVIDGSTGQEQWQSSVLVNGGAQISVGDINNDGHNEVVTVENYGTPSNPEYRPIAFTHTGNILWRADPDISCGRSSIADLDQDGDPEVVCSDHEILNGADGSVKSTGGSQWVSNGGSAVANIDMSGYPEVINGCSARSFDGNSFTDIWNVCGSHSHGRVAVGNVDTSDDYPEVVVVRGGRHETISGGTSVINPEYSTVALFDHQGNQLWRVDIPYQVGSSGGGCVSYYNKDTGSNNRSTCHHYGGGPPTVADFDHDGEVEIGVASADYYVVFEGDGSVLWTQSNQDYSSAGTGSSVFDFDFNGQAEVLYADEEYFRIFNGANGNILFEEPNDSGTLTEYPVIADIDDDGKVEIVVAQNCYGSGDPDACAGIRVFGNADPGSCDFPNTRKIWNQHSYHITNVANDGSIPQIESNNWEVFNNWRQNIMDFTAVWCGDGRCDSGESSSICPIDCP